METKIHKKNQKKIIKFIEKPKKEFNNSNELLRLTIFSILILVFFQFSQKFIENDKLRYFPMFEMFEFLTSIFLYFPFMVFMIYVMLLGLKYTYSYKINISDSTIHQFYDFGILFLSFFAVPSFIVFMLAGVLNLTALKVFNGIAIGYFSLVGLALLFGYFNSIIFIFKLFLKKIDLSKKKFYEFEEFQIFWMGSFLITIILRVIWNIYLK
jgi:hypothetical protein